MRHLLILGALALGAVLPAGTTAQAREYPWCARYSGWTYNCGFVSFQQCLATVSGDSGAYCDRNPRYVPERPAKRRSH